MSDLGAVHVTPKTGDEPILQHGQIMDATLRGFWTWACSDLLSNAMRGVLAEYLVGLALGCVDGTTRLEWDATDLCTADGLRVEVKSSAYLQSWEQKRLSAISFGIAPANGWDHATNTYFGERVRQSDVYVFCVLNHTDKATVNPLDVDQWDFYVMPTGQVNAAFGGQKSVSLTSLLRHHPVKASFSELSALVEAAASDHG